MSDEWHEAWESILGETEIPDSFWSFSVGTRGVRLVADDGHHAFIEGDTLAALRAALGTKEKP